LVSVPPGAISIDHASKRYGSQSALREVSFEIASGEAVGYLGPNGAGKTTTLRLLAGLARPDGGTVRLMGLDPALQHDRALRRVGVLVETPGVVPYVTSRDLLSHVARVKRVSPSEEARQIRSLAERLGFLAQLDRPIGTLSTGLTRRLLLAVALVGDPEVLLLDEPTLGLDPAARADLRKILRGLRSEGRTLLLSTHLLDDVEEVCSPVLFLRDGTIVAGRVLLLRFASDVSEAAVHGALDEEGEVAANGARELTLRFSGDDGHQAELLARIVRAGLPLLTAGDGRPTLAERYLDRVGREDPA
jgi:ABC-2 type transport system ATP-binding protein